MIQQMLPPQLLLHIKIPPKNFFHGEAAHSIVFPEGKNVRDGTRIFEFLEKVVDLGGFFGYNTLA